MEQSSEQDHIKINKLQAEVPLLLSEDGSSWTKVLQKTEFTVDIRKDISLAAHYDDVWRSIDYSIIASRIRQICTSDHNGFKSIMDVAEKVISACIVDAPEELMLQVKVVDPLENVVAMAVHVAYRGGSIAIENLSILDAGISALIGLNPSERLMKQPVIINV